jgi:tricorn protease-like protein
MINNMSEYIKVAVIVVIAMTIAAAVTIIPTQKVYALYINGFPKTDKAPITVSGDNNVYVIWSTDKRTPNNNAELMFKASTDSGKTFSNKTNLSNTARADSVDGEIAATGNNVYVTWWERANATSTEPVMRISNDNGKSFGEIVKLSAK